MTLVDIRDNFKANLPVKEISSVSFPQYGEGSYKIGQTIHVTDVLGR